MLDCLIIGGGPAGLTAAVYLGRYRRSLCVIDDGDSRARLIPTSHNYPGFKGVGGEELLQRLRDQALAYDLRLERGRVESLAIAGSAFIARAGTKEIEARTIILATGIVDTKPPFHITNGDPRHVIRYCPICDGFEATDRRVAVLGGADAGKKAAFLRTFTDKVSWFTADDHPSTSSDDIKALQLAPIGQAVAIDTSSDGVRITTTDGARHDFDLLYPALGCEVRSGLATTLGAHCRAIGTLIVDEHQQTSVGGLYAVGDVVSDLHQIAVGTGHAAIAATAVHNRLPRNLR